MATPKHWQQTNKVDQSYTTYLSTGSGGSVFSFFKSLSFVSKSLQAFLVIFQTNSILFVNWHVILDSKGLAIVDY